MVRIDFATLNAYLSNRQCPVFMYSDGTVSLELDLKKRLIGCWDNLNDASADLKQSVDICVRVGNQLLERCFPFYVDTDWRVVTQAGRPRSLGEFGMDWIMFRNRVTVCSRKSVGMRLQAGNFHRIRMLMRIVKAWSAGLILTNMLRKDNGD